MLRVRGDLSRLATKLFAFWVGHPELSGAGISLIPESQVLILVNVSHT